MLPIAAVQAVVQSIGAGNAFLGEVVGNLVILLSLPQAWRSLIRKWVQPVFVDLEGSIVLGC